MIYLKAFGAWCVIVALAWCVSGCSTSLSLGPERWRVFHWEGEGFETFCWEGMGIPVADSTLGIRAVGWGQHSCADIIDGTLEPE